MENYSIKRMNRGKTLPDKPFTIVLQFPIFYNKEPFRLLQS